MAFFIYENWQAGPHKMVIHYGSCGFCNEGTGRSRGGYDPSHARWHGPFATLHDARRESESRMVPDRRECACVARFDR